MAVAGRNLMNTGNEVILNPMVICSSVSDFVSEGILLIIQRFFDLYLRLTTKCSLLYFHVLRP